MRGEEAHGRPSAPENLSKVGTREGPPQVHGPRPLARSALSARSAVHQLALVVGQTDAGSVRVDRPATVAADRSGSGGPAGCGHPGTARRAGHRRAVPERPRPARGRSGRLPEPADVVSGAADRRRRYADGHRLLLDGVRRRRGAAQLFGWSGHSGRRPPEVGLGSGSAADRRRPVLPVRVLPPVADRRRLAARELSVAGPAGTSAAVADRRSRGAGAGGAGDAGRQSAAGQGVGGPGRADTAAAVGL